MEWAWVCTKKITTIYTSIYTVLFHDPSVGRKYAILSAFS